MYKIVEKGAFINRIRFNSSRGSRAFKILYAFILFSFVIILRLFYLQIKQKNVLTGMGERNFLKIEVINPPRGNLLDCKGVLMASNRPVFDLYWQGSGSKDLDEARLELLNKIEQILGVKLLEEPMRQNILIAEKYSRRIELCQNIKFDQLCRISELEGSHPKLVVSNRFERVYLHGSLASHVLGFLNRIEKIGKAGLEKLLESELQGQPGYVLSVTNSTGKKLALKDFREAKAGEDIKLTIDIDLQQMAESLFTPGQTGAFIMMDPEDGAIKVLASFPGFDPNAFLSPISEDEWEKLAENNPLLNRATCALCPPASTFKLVSIAAGIEEGVITPQSEFFCKGYVEFCGRKYHCMRHSGHGMLTPQMALAASCNSYCFEIAKRIKVDTLALYAKRFGLGQKTNFLLPENAGLVPCTAWKRLVKHERWWKGETLSVSVGQGYLMTTPLQIARLVAAVCSGKLVRPRILEQEAVESEPIEISKRTLKVLKGGMRSAVQEGTVKILSYVKDFKVYAKTGTAQTCDLSRERTSKAQLEHAWVAGFFKYANEKPLAITVFIENVGSSGPALMMINKFLRAYKALRESGMGKPKI
jgi:penicillin-binding protein 2